MDYELPEFDGDEKSLPERRSNHFQSCPEDISKGHVPTFNWQRRCQRYEKYFIVALLFALFFLIGFALICSKSQWEAQNQSQETIKKLEEKLKNFDERQNAIWSRHSKEFTAESRCAAGWIPFSHKKCFKILDIFVNESDARAICIEELKKSGKTLDPSDDGQSGESLLSFDLSPILTVDGGAEEQTFVNQLVFADTGYQDSVWLGGRRVSTAPIENTENDTDTSVTTDRTPAAIQFIWHVDEKDNKSRSMDYTNWKSGSPSNIEENSCMEMTPIGTKANKGWSTVNGRWADVSCHKRNLVVCQTRQTLSMTQLKLSFLEFRSSVLNQLQILQSRPQVPPGFIYMQLPSQFGPKILWPTFTWEDVTLAYAGLFFRAEGNGSAPFGIDQSDQVGRRIDNVEYDDRTARSSSLLTLPTSGWSNYVISGHYYGSTSNARGLRFHMDENGENRPKNTAIRIWRRK